jgi:threonine dehydratase
MTITFEDIQKAHGRLLHHALETPLLSNYFLNQRLNAQVYIKAECLQHCGAFKFRGAYNRLVQLTDAEKKQGVVAFSSGNHAQGVALAAQLLNIPAIIVMPDDAPKVKLERTRAYGAEVISYNRQTESREAIAQELATSRKAVLVPSFDDPHIIAGQGTCGLELAAQLQKQQQQLEMLLSPAGGGGLIAGVSVAVKQAFPDCRIYAVEPDGFDDHGRSLQSGQREVNPQGGNSLCDALLSPSPGELTWAINQKNLCQGLVVTDDEVCHAISYAYHYLKLVVEPGGAVALAALLHQKIDIKGRHVGIILSGGNIDTALLMECLRQYPNP